MSLGGFEDVLRAGEQSALSWEASDVRWAGTREDPRDSPIEFAATERRLLLSNGSRTVTVEYDHVRAIECERSGSGPGLTLAFGASGAVGLFVGLVVTTRDFVDGLGLIVLSLMLLGVGSTVGDSFGTDHYETTLVIDNERQRLTFVTSEDVAPELRKLVAGADD
ncbi:hypothetical protein [Halorussus halophilus]|uniref:hypothetical protein n=1 Tax=Halorussus halophilus TaxID=2650975 RepID=UPI0013012D59|nr:hypothetical protein [Halorussus halophilus]